MKKLLVSAALATLVGTCAATAQEACFQTAENTVSDWAQTNSTTLRDLWAQHDAAANPAAVVVNYQGQNVPLFFALEQETIRYKAGLAATQEAAFKGAENCSSALDVAIPRQTWDVFRSFTFPSVSEEKLRIDFEQLRRNPLGGDKSAPRVIGRQIDKIANPFRW